MKSHKKSDKQTSSADSKNSTTTVTHWLSGKLSPEAAILLADETIKCVKKLLPLGSVNKKSDEKRHGNKFESRIKLIGDNNKDVETEIALQVAANNPHTLALYADPSISPDALDEAVTNKLPFTTYINLHADSLEKIKLGNCQGQIFVGLRKMKKMGINDVDICRVIESEHNFLLFGGTVICDLWLDLVFTADDFSKHQNMTRNFQYADLYYASFAGEDKTALPPYESTVISYRPKYLKDDFFTYPPAVENGHFVRAIKKEDAGNGRALKFALVRYSFLKTFHPNEDAPDRCKGVAIELIAQANKLFPLK